MPNEEQKNWRLLLMRLMVFSVYFFAGAAIFMLIEKGDPDYFRFNRTAIIEKVKQDVMEKYEISEEEFGDLARNIFAMSTPEPNTPWSYFESLTYVLHLLTTIGYGTITTKTEVGQIVTIIYGLFGIPLTLLTLKAMGSSYNEAMMKIITAIETKCLKRDQVKRMEVKVVFFNVFITFIYLVVAALVSVSTDKYKYSQSVYVWFITMTTVGFGDFVPKVAADASQFYNILIGLCFMSGTIDAMVSYQERKEEGTRSKKNNWNCLLCCNRNSNSLQIQTVSDDNANQANVELTEEVSGSANDKQTQTTGIFNYFGHYDD